MDQQKQNRFSTTNHKITQKGKPRACFTLRCEFNDGNTFTYRSDINLENYKKQGYKDIDEMDGLVLKFSGLKNLCHEAKIFDNSKPQGEDILMHFAMGRVLLNRIPKKPKKPIL